MKKYCLVLALILSFWVINIHFSSAQKHKIKVTLDTKKMTNVDCDLNADGMGGPSPLVKVYMHSGLCTKSLKGGTSDHDFCNNNIIPYGSQVWEHVVGNWGSAPKDDGVGLMTTVGNGVYTMEYIMEDYYSNPALVNLDWNDAKTIQSTPMEAGGVPYVMGVVFRDAKATYSGRDDNCYDLFITGLETTKPKVIQSYDYGAPFPALTAQVSIVTGTSDQLPATSFQFPANITSINPNPMTDNAKIVFNVDETGKDISLSVFNLTGQEVKSLYKGKLAKGDYSISWNGTDVKGNRVSDGIYFISLKSSGTNLSTRRIVVY
jgi:hypothetical protein